MGVGFEDCWYCQKALAHCKSKKSFPGIVQAVATAQEINIANRWQRPLRPYWCRWCELYHLATAKRKGDARKAERNRRKWLRRQLEGSD